MPFTRDNSQVVLTSRHFAKPGPSYSKYQNQAIVMTWLATSSYGNTKPGRRQVPGIYPQATIDSIPNPSVTAGPGTLET